MAIIDPADFRIELFNAMASGELGLTDQVVVYDAATGKPFRITLSQLDAVVGSGGGGGGGDALTTDPLSQFAATTSAQLLGIITDETGTGALVFGTNPTITINASCLAAGTIPDARFPATLPAASGANLTALNATNLASGTVAPARLGTGSGGATKFLREDSTWQTVAGGSGATEYTINEQTASYTTVLGDAGPLNLIRMNVISANNLTIPPFSSVAYPVGSIIQFEQMGAGATTIVAGSGVTINRMGNTSAVLVGQGAQGTLICTAADEWQLYAQLVSTLPAVTSPTISGGTLTLDLTTSRCFVVALDAAITSHVHSGFPASGTLCEWFEVYTADGTPRAITFDAAIVWPDNTAPTITSTNGKRMVFRFFTVDGGAEIFGSYGAGAF